MTERNRRKMRVGRVVSDRMEKTIVVEVRRTLKHPLYGRVIRTRSKIHAHDEQQEAGIGDTVRVMECRPMSKQKRWRLIEILEKAK